MNANVMPIDFAAHAAKRPSLKAIGGGIYNLDGDKGFWARPRLHGKQKKIRLKALTSKFARIELGKLEGDIVKFEQGLGPNPFAPAVVKQTLADLCEFFIAKGCPGKRRGTAGAASTIRDEKKHVATLLTWPGMKTAAVDFGAEDSRIYHAWRSKRIRDGSTGDRQIDRELGTLAAVFRCAIQHSNKTGITINPLQDRHHFCKSETVRHCRVTAPDDADQLHALAHYLFQSRRSEVLGWQVLLQAHTGLRIHELGELRIDALPGQAGYIDEARKVLWLPRSETCKGTFEFCELDAIRTRDKRISTPLRELLEAFLVWHQLRYPNSPWYFPSAENSKQAIGTTALTHALRRVSKLLGQPLRTSHGIRAFFVKVLRSHRVPDGEVALRIGQKTGGKLIVDIYGVVPPQPLSWLPATIAPAWKFWDKTSAQSEEQLSLDL